MPTETPLSLALVLTAGGAVGVAGLITGLIQLIKSLPGVGPAIQNRSLEPLLAFAFSAAIVILAFVNIGIYTLETGFAAFVAWYGIARIAMSVYDDAKNIVAPVTPA